MSPDATWKRAERAVAAIIGGERVPVSGRQRGDVPDVAHHRLSVEVKHRRTVPGWLVDALDQAEAAARADHVPVAIIHRHGGRHRDDLAILRLADLATLLDDPARRTPP
jgi:hypothetical protein